MLAVCGDPAAVPTDASKWDGVIPEANKDYVFVGEGTEADPWLIRSAADLAMLAANARLNDKTTTYGGKYFKLTVDIDMDNKGWWGIGGCRAGADATSTKDTDPNRFSYFAGIFDGDNHKIYNFALADTAEIDVVVDETTGATEKQIVPLYQQGLFGLVMGGTVKNIGIESGEINMGTTTFVGALIGIGRCGFRLENCYNKANITILTDHKAVYIGGLVGRAVDKWDNANNTEQTTENVFKVKHIVNCYNTGDVHITMNTTNGKNEYRIGGIAGQFVGDAPEMVNVYCVADVTVISNSVPSSGTNHCVGGITGAFLDKAYAEHLYFKGDVTFTATNTPDYNYDLIGILLGRVTIGGSVISFTSDPDENGVYTIGYCSKNSTLNGQPITEVVGNATFEWMRELDDVVIPLAKNSDFIVDVHAEPETPIVTDAPTDAITTAPETPKTDAPTDAITTAPEAPKTDAPTQEATQAPTTQAPTEEKGCGASAGLLSVMLIGAMTAASALCIRRKNED